MELLPVVCLCLLTRCGITSANGNDPIVAKVEEDRNVILPCSLSTKENIESIVFDWRKTQKDGKREVFYYEAGIHYNNGRPGQSEEFKGRVSHFQDELKHGNASIIIRNAKLADSGDYTCDFPYLHPRQKFPIELVVDCVLKDRTRDKKHGTCPKPDLKIIGSTKNGVLLECNVIGAFPIPEVELKNSAGTILPVEERKVTDRGDLYDITLRTTVTKTDNYSCVSTQEEICHQIFYDTHVPVNGAATEPYVTILKQTDDGELLQCVVRGASPKPKAEWKDSSGNKLPAEEPQVTDRGGSYDIILQTTVTKTDDYSCVVTQEEINHQTETKIYVSVNDPPTGWIGILAGVLGTVLFFVIVGGVVLAVLVHKGCITLHCNKGSPAAPKDGSAAPLNG